MIAELIAAFGQVVEPWEAAVAGGLATASALLGGLVLAPPLSRVVLPRPKETRLADHLPFESVLKDGATLRCRDGRLARVVEMLGVDATPKTQDERRALMAQRKAWIETFRNYDCELKVIVQRTRSGVEEIGDFPEDVAPMRNVARSWHAPLEASYRNRFYLVISIKGESEQARRRLHEIVEDVGTYLGEYRPRPLRHAPEGPSPLLGFLSELVNPTLPVQLGGFHDDIAARIVASTVHFLPEAGYAVFRDGPKEVHMAALGIQRWGPSVSAELIQEVLSLDVELSLCHLVKVDADAQASLFLSQRARWAFSGRFSSSEAEEIELAKEWVESQGDGHQSLCHYQLTIFVYGADREEVDQGVAKLRRVLANTGGIRAVREGASVLPLWFSLFPGTQHLLRDSTLFSQNVAELVSFETPAQGFGRSAWGPGPIAVFRTLSGSPYRYQYHHSEEPEAPGHVLTIGPTGSGKTALMTFLAGFAMRHAKLRTYIFDSFQGAYVFTTALGGRYLSLQTEIEAEAAATLNPMQQELNRVNVEALKTWLTLISGCEDAESQEEIGRAIALLERIPRSDRSLAGIFREAFTPSGELAKALLRWVDRRQKGAVFNGVKDTLDLSQARLVAFDMTRIFEDEELTRAFVPYLMHRIRGTVAEAEAPYLVLFDETSHMLRHKLLARFFNEELQQARKRHGVVVCAFQEPGSLWQTDSAEVVTTNCKTTILFRNPQAKLEDYAPFNLTDYEQAFIKGTLSASAHLSKAVLIKRDTPAGPESVILDIDLRPLGRLFGMFRSGRQAVDAAMRAQATWPRGWLDKYLAEIG